MSSLLDLMRFDATSNMDLIDQPLRGRAETPSKHKAPTSYRAEAANQVWSWDIPYLLAPVRGQFYYLYLFFEDIYSRKAVDWEVYEQESDELAAGLLQHTVMIEQSFTKPPVLHSDNGAPMKSLTLIAKMYDLGLTPSRGRPRTSSDAPYSESLFRTLKCCPQWPVDGFASIEAARTWVREFIMWYNNQHCHCGIRFFTPSQRHRGEDKPISKKRHELNEPEKQKRPERWLSKTRNREPIGAVNLNP